MTVHRTIELIAPSGYPHDSEVLHRALHRLHAQGHRVEGEEATRRRYLRFGGTDGERAAGPIIDDDLLAELLGKGCRKHARHRIGGAAGGLRHDQPDRMIGKLRPRRGRDGAGEQKHDESKAAHVSARRWSADHSRDAIASLLHQRRRFGRERERLRRVAL